MAESGQPLAALGLTALEAEVFASLVMHPRSSPQEIAETVGTVPVEATAALTGLVARGLATRVPGMDTAYTAAAPDVTLGSMVAARESELRTARDAVDRLTEIHREATRFTHPAHLVEVLSGRGNIAGRIGQVQDDARTQIRGFGKPPYVSAPPGNFAPQKERLAQGVSYRVIYDREATAWPGYLDDVILPLRELGEQSRVAAELPMKLFIGDDRIAVIPIISSQHVADAAYVVHPCALLDALITLFELLWVNAVPVAQSSPQHEEVDPDGRALLTLLASGATDAGIARSLGWSARTTQRRTRKLMDDLAVTTRFQAGLAARERGWI